MPPTDVSAIDDVRIDGINDLVAPNEIISRYPVSDTTTALIRSTRAKIAAIMRGDDERLLVVIGPCSIHDSEAALEYARRLMSLREQHADKHSSPPLLPPRLHVPGLTLPMINCLKLPGETLTHMLFTIFV